MLHVIHFISSTGRHCGKKTLDKAWVKVFKLSNTESWPDSTRKQGFSGIHDPRDHQENNLLHYIKIVWLLRFISHPTNTRGKSIMTGSWIREFGSMLTQELTPSHFQRRANTELTHIQNWKVEYTAIASKKPTLRCCQVQTSIKYCSYIQAKLWVAYIITCNNKMWTWSNQNLPRKYNFHFDLPIAAATLK